MEFCSYVDTFVQEGHGHRKAARQVRVSPEFVKDMVILKRARGGLVRLARLERQFPKSGACRDGRMT